MLRYSKHFRQYFHSNASDNHPIILVKVGGAVLTEQMGILLESLVFMRRSGLRPIVVHGGGPQLNDILQSHNITPKYTNGIRVTDKKTLEIAKNCFRNENMKLVENLERNGIHAFPIASGVFSADYMDKAKYDLVGKIQKVDTNLIQMGLNYGIIPVIASLSETPSGQLLNINADTAASELAKSLKPYKTLFLSSNGGIHHPLTGKEVKEINLSTEYQELVEELGKLPKKGTMLKLMEVYNILQNLPKDSSVSILKPNDIIQDLKGEGRFGTLVYYSQKPKSMIYQQRRTYSQTISSENRRKRIGLIGARGYTGQELVNLIDKHSHLDLACISSRELVGKSLFLPHSEQEIVYENLSPKSIEKYANDVDCWILALPNSICSPFVESIQNCMNSSIVDLSADYRFDNTWVYGLPELYKSRDIIRNKILKHERVFVSNPGCYATGMQIGLYPLMKSGIIDNSYKPVVFGVSGYSGAGTNQTMRNDLNRLEDNLIPYSLCGHVHEKEVGHQLKSEVEFIPHVAPFFRGITLTINCQLSKIITEDEVRSLYNGMYSHEPLITILEKHEGDCRDGIPLVKEISQSHNVQIGGFKCSDRRLVLVVTIDNLLKGAATQCMQNINLTLGYNEYESIL